MAHDLNGVWQANDGGIYYIRQQGDLVTWAGLHASGFHMGMEFANIFQGRIGPDGMTLKGEWVDVPRGATNSSGTLGLQIVEVGAEAMVPPPPPRLELRQIPTETTGGFGGTLWTKNGSLLGDQDIVDITNRVRRYDMSFGENNPPFRDFSVLWGTVGKVDLPKLPPSPDDYCSFLQCDDDWDGDGDISFDLTNLDWSRIQPDFWTSGWINNQGDILWHFDRSNHEGSTRCFHCEVAMYGRENDCDHCSTPPVILLPAWKEQGGHSVLVNGHPIEGRYSVVRDHRVPPPNEGLEFYDRSGRVTGLLMPGTVVRVSGVVAKDNGHWDAGQPPEIHAVYGFDIVQDFSPPRAEHTNLTGVWHSSDGGTYYLRHFVDPIRRGIGDVLWWLGLSRDQGRSFANVFRGTVVNNTISGTWVDVPMGVGGALGGGDMVLHGSSLSTQLVRIEEAGGVTIWNKLYDTPATLPSSRLPISEAELAAMLDSLAKGYPAKLDWKVSILDLLVLLKLDSSFKTRQEMAVKLGCPSELMKDSAKMNVFLHQTILKKIAENGGNLPPELLDYSV